MAVELSKRQFQFHASIIDARRHLSTRTFFEMNEPVLCHCLERSR